MSLYWNSSMPHYEYTQRNILQHINWFIIFFLACTMPHHGMCRHEIMIIYSCNIYTQWWKQAPWVLWKWLCRRCWWKDEWMKIDIEKNKDSEWVRRQCRCWWTKIDPLVGKRSCSVGVIPGWLFWKRWTDMVFTISCKKLRIICIFSWLFLG